MMMDGLLEARQGAAPGHPLATTAAARGKRRRGEKWPTYTLRRRTDEGAGKKERAAKVGAGRALKGDRMLGGGGANWSTAPARTAHACACAAETRERGRK